MARRDHEVRQALQGRRVQRGRRVRRVPQGRRVQRGRRARRFAGACRSARRGRRAGSNGPRDPWVHGATGPAGSIAGIETSVRAEFSDAGNGAGASNIIGNASCPTGKRAIGGGFESLGFAALMVPINSYPAAESSWRVTLRNPATTALNTVQMRVYVVCAPAD